MEGREAAAGLPHLVRQGSDLHQQLGLPGAALSDGQLQEAGPVLDGLVEPVGGGPGAGLHLLGIEEVGEAAEVAGAEEEERLLLRPRCTADAGHPEAALPAALQAAHPLNSPS